jgi:hypothetical protein
VWKYLQQANVSWKAPVGSGLLFEAGIFLSPIGPEGMAVKEQWNWSRSSLFFGLPFYHTGARVTVPLTKEASITLAGYNGWSSVVDGNDDKSVALQVTYNHRDRWIANFVYFGGAERPAGAAEGRPWRHTFDVWLAHHPTSGLSWMAHADAGFEENRFGKTTWGAGAAYLRLRPKPWLYVAARGDLLYESRPDGAAAIFFPVPWLSSGTLTFDFRAHANVSLRLEYRHDHAAGDAYYRGAVPDDGAGGFRANVRSQDSLLAGVVTWF